MTIELLSLVLTAFGAAATVLGGVATMLGLFTRRLDARLDRVDARFERVDEQLAELRRDVAANTVAIARLEGPPPRLMLGASR